MGLFNSKKCSICENKGVYKVIDGEICRECFSKFLRYKAPTVSDIKNLKTTKHVSDIKNVLDIKDQNSLLIDTFVESSSFGPLSFDFNNNLLMLSIPVLKGIGKKDVVREIYKFEDILSYSVIEDGNTLTSGGLGMATIGAITFGGIGAVVGAITGAKKTKKEVLSLDIIINLKMNEQATLKVPFIHIKTKTKSPTYKQATEDVRNCVSSLERAVKEIEELKNNNTTSNNSVSEVDEIRKYKELLDDGIITQEEFDLKKKQLLDL